MEKANHVKPTSQNIKHMLLYDLNAFHEKCAPILMPGTDFIESWYAQHISHRLMRVLERKCKRLVINAPPRIGKSSQTTVVFPIYCLIQNPSLKIMTVTYGGELASFHHNQRRKLLKLSWIRKLAPGLHEKSSHTLKDNEHWIETSAGGSIYSTTLHGSITGLGADILIIDDPNSTTESESKAMRDAVINAFKTCVTRLNHKDCPIIIVQQRTHIEDLSGYVLSLGSDQWTQIKLPAIEEQDSVYDLGHGKVANRPKGSLIAPERFGSEEIEELRKSLGSARFEAQYQQNPLPPEGTIIKRKWLKFVDTLPDFQYLIFSVDTAGSENQGDYSAFLVWGFLGRGEDEPHLLRHGTRSSIRRCHSA